MAQQGVFFDVTSASGWSMAQGVSDQSSDWKNALESGAYPYAKWPLKKLVFRLPSLATGTSPCLATLLAASRSAEARYRIVEPKPGVIRIESLTRDLPKVKIEDGDLSIRGDGAALEVRFAASPSVPPALKAWAAK